MTQQPLNHHMMDPTNNFGLRVTKQGIDPYGDPDHLVVTEGYEIQTGKPYIRVKYSTPPFTKSDFVCATLCDACSKFLANPKRCSRCKNRNYCSKGCQKLDWRAEHKYECQQLHESPDEKIKFYENEGNSF